MYVCMYVPDLPMPAEQCTRSGERVCAVWLARSTASCCLFMTSRTYEMKWDGSSGTPKWELNEQSKMTIQIQPALFGLTELRFTATQYNTIHAGKIVINSHRDQASR